MKNVVIIGNQNVGGFDDTNTTMYVCPKCQQGGIYREFRFCPGCGSKLAWNLNDAEQSDNHQHE